MSGSSKRVNQACVACRLGKSRCSGDQPCTRCTEQDIACSFAESRPLVATLNHKANDLESRLGELEATLAPVNFEARLQSLERGFGLIPDDQPPDSKRQKLDADASSADVGSGKQKYIGEDWFGLPAEQATAYWDAWLRLSRGDAPESWWFGWLALHCSLQQARAQSTMLLAAGLAVGAKARGQHSDAAHLVQEARYLCRHVLSPTGPSQFATRTLFDLHGCLILASFFSIPISGPLIQLTQHLGLHRAYAELQADDVAGSSSESALIDRLRLYLSVVIYDHLFSLLSGLSAATSFEQMKLACGVLNNSRFSQKHRDRIISFFVDMLSVVNEADRKLNISTRLGSSDYNALCMVAEQQVANLDVVCKNWRSVLWMDPVLRSSEALVNIPGHTFRTIILAYAVLPLSALNIVPATPQRLHLALQAVESAKACLREVAAAPQIAQAPSFAHELCLVLVSACIKFLYTAVVHLTAYIDVADIKDLLRQVHTLMTDKLLEHDYLEPMQTLLRAMDDNIILTSPIVTAPPPSLSYSPEDYINLNDQSSYQQMLVDNGITPL